MQPIFQHSKLALASLATGLLFAGASAVSAQEHKIDISLETGPNHVRNLSVVKFADELNKKSGGKLKVKVFHGASKYKGTNVPTALAQGALDMGMPGTWHLGKFVSEFNAPGLPVLYGAKRDIQYKLWDGPVGKELVSKLENKLKVKVIGRWIDLGYGQMFFVKKKVTSHADLQGMKIRAPGGAANLARYEGFDAKAIKISWPDVPQALQRGTVDGVLTTHESVRSAKLWDSGLKYAYDDYQGFFQYVPVMSKRAWDKLPKDLQDLIVSTWEAKVDEMRKFAEERQNSARSDGAKNGIQRTDASDADIAAMRTKLMKGQADLVTKLKMDPAFIAKINAALGS
ncbi:MAG: TRAP transporter substrate-binding protein DctP [Methyloligellaceae bacterium]